MKLLVAVKRVIDYNVNVRVKADGSGVETANVRMAMNPFDEIAVEEAVRLKEKGKATHITVVTIGPGTSQETVRTALAMGADAGLHILCDDPSPEPLTVASLLKAVVARNAPDLVLLGKQAIDDDCNQCGQMLAALLDWPQGVFASKIATCKGGEIEVTREVDGGLETLALRLPAVVTTDLRLNTPRYASLPNIMKARRLPIESVTPESLGVSVRRRCEILKVEEPQARKAGVEVRDVDELVDKLRNVAGVLP